MEEIMDLREQITVSGVAVRLQPYTEKRRKALDKVTAEVNEFVAKDPTRSWDDFPVAEKAKFWKRKAEILWEPVVSESQKKELEELWCHKSNFLSDLFFQSDEFEYTMIQKTEFFFLNQRVYL
jgi:hypothetical protein